MSLSLTAMWTAPEILADTNCPAAVEPSQSGGVYLLGTPSNLQWVKDANVGGTNAQWGSSYRINRDIDMGGCTWDSVIGGVAPFFTGSFNGAGYLISGLTIAINVTGGIETASYVGLFGRTETESVIENVGFNGIVSATIDQLVLLGSITHTLEIGALIGGSRGGIVRQSFTTGNVTGSVSTRSGNASDHTVNSTGVAGGLIGHSESAIFDSYATGTVNLTVNARSDAGNGATRVISRAYAAGLLGRGGGVIVSRSYSTGSPVVSGGGTVIGDGNLELLTLGAAAIAENDAILNANAWNSTTAGGVGIQQGTQTGGAGLYEGFTSAQMRDVATFGPTGLNWDIAGDCALTRVWNSCATRNDGFPALSIFSLADRSGDDPEQAPPPIMQQVGLMPGQECSDLDVPDLNWAGVSSEGWGQSWAQWAVPVTGGPVCVRVLFYDSPRSRWAVRT